MSPYRKVRTGADDVVVLDAAPNRRITTAAEAVVPDTLLPPRKSERVETHPKRRAAAKRRAHQSTRSGDRTLAISS